MANLLLLFLTFSKQSSYRCSTNDIGRLQTCERSRRFHICPMGPHVVSLDLRTCVCRLRRWWKSCTYWDRNELFMSPILSGVRIQKGFVHGAEYQTHDSFLDDLKDHDVPCAVCKLNSSNVLMIPARQECYEGLMREYHGFLMSGREVHVTSKVFVCMDGEPEFIPGTQADKKRRIVSFSGGCVWIFAVFALYGCSRNHLRRLYARFIMCLSDHFIWRCFV